MVYMAFLELHQLTIRRQSKVSLDPMFSFSFRLPRKLVTCFPELFLRGQWPEDQVRLDHAHRYWVEVDYHVEDPADHGQSF